MKDFDNIVRKQFKDPRTLEKHNNTVENYKHDPKLAGQQIRLALDALEQLFKQFSNDHPAPANGLGHEKGEYALSRLFDKGGLYHVAAILEGKKVDGKPLVQTFVPYLENKSTIHTSSEQRKKNNEEMAGNINHVILNGSMDKGLVKSFSGPLLQIATKMAYEFLNVFQAHQEGIHITNSSLTALTILPNFYHDIKAAYYGEKGLIRDPQSVKYDGVNLDLHIVAKNWVEPAEKDLEAFSKYIQQKAAVKIEIPVARFTMADMSEHASIVTDKVARR